MQQQQQEKFRVGDLVIANEFLGIVTAVKGKFIYAKDEHGKVVRLLASAAHVVADVNTILYMMNEKMAAYVRKQYGR